MKNQRSLYLIPLFLFLFQSLNAQNDYPTIAPASHIGGNVEAAAFTENHGYLSQGGYLTILDLSTDPFAQIAYMDIKGEPTDMEIKDGYLYLIGSHLLIYDLTDEMQPELVGELAFGTTTEPQLFISDNTLYTVSYDEGLRIIDISDLMHPELITHYSDGSDYGDVVVVDDYAYILDNNFSSLKILDISDPQNPVETGQVNVQAGPNALYIDKDIAYITVFSFPNIGMRIFDLEDKSNPVEIGYIETKTVDGNVTHYDTPKKILVENNYAYVACSTESSLYVFDVEDPSDPIQFSRLGLQPVWEGGPVSMQKIANDIYLSYRWSGKSVRKINVSDLTSMELENLYESPHDVLWIQSGMDYLYLADQSRLWIYDMSDLYNPAPVSSHDDWGFINRMFLDNNLLYCSRGDSLFVLDVSNPMALDQLSFVKLEAWPSEMIFQDSYLFVLLDKNPGNVKVFDLTDPYNPTEMSSFDLSGIGHGLFYDKDSQLLTAGIFKNPLEYGFDLYYLSSISNPSYITTVQTASAPNTVAIDGDHLIFAGNRDNGGVDQWHIEAFDISTPASPVLTSQLASNGQLWDMEIREGIIFAGVPGNTIYMISLINDLLSIFEECPSETTREISISPVNMNTYTCYGASIDGDGYSYPTGKKDLSGTDGVPIQIIIWPPPELCCLKTVVRPEIAASPFEPYECSSVPDCATGTCGSGTIVKASPGPEWVFTHWSGAAGGNSPTTNASITGMTGCPNCPDNVAYAHFTPWLKNSGGASLWDCPFEEEDEVIALVFNLEASKADSWMINMIDVKISGDEDLSQYIKKAKLKWTSEEEKEHSGNGTISFSTAGLTLEPGKGQELTLYLTFKAMTDIKCPSEPKEITIQVETSGVDANALTYGPGKVIGQASGTFSVSCVRNITQNEDYETITEAEEAAMDNEEIWVCPGDYEENIQVDKENLKIYAPKGPNETYVLAKENNQPGFQLKANGITVEGFGVRNATQSYGIYVYGSTVENTTLKNNRLGKNKHGIYLQDAKNTTIENCSAYENEESGLHVINSKISTIKASSFYDNKQNGIYFENCIDNDQEYSKITQTAVRENKLNGVYLKNCKYPVFENNISINKNDSTGVKIEDCEHIVVQNTPFIDENKNGVQIVNSTSCIIHNNKISENAEKGIVLTNCPIDKPMDANHITKNVIVGNRLSGKQKHGIYLKDASYTYLGFAEGINEIRSHKLNGISIIGGNKNKIEGDSIFWNDANGIYLKNTCDNFISGKVKLGPENNIGLKIESCLCKSDEVNIVQNARIISNNTNGIYMERSNGNSVGTEGNSNTISGNKENGVELFECQSTDYDENTFTANKVFENTKYGFMVDLSDYNVFRKNEIWSNKSDGIRVQRESYGNEFIENVIDGKNIQEYGVIISNSDKNILDNNTLMNHKKSAVWISETKEGATLLNNKIEKNKMGIHCESSSKISIGKNEEVKGANTLKNNTDAGVFVEKCDGKGAMFISNNHFVQEKIGLLIEGSKDMLLDNNDFSEKNEAAILIRDLETNLDKAIKIENNKIINCLANGINLENAQGVIIGGDVISKSNQIKGNKGNGILVKDCKPPYGINGFINKIKKNTIYGKNNNGIYLVNSQFTEIRENNVFQNNKDGIRLSNSLWNTIVKNSCRENKASGIALKQSEQNKIGGNELLRNEESGLYLFKSNYNDIPLPGKDPNVINENEDHGIRLDDCFENKIRSAEIKNNKKHGIVINQGQQNHIYGPMEIMDNTKDGIQLSNTSYNRIWNRTTATRKKINYAIKIKSNGSQGIHLKKSHNNSFSSIRIWKHTTGLLLEHSNNNNFTMDVRILLNWLGGHGICSYSSSYGLCTYHNNVSTTLVDGCSIVPEFYDGCHFLSSEENAFTLSNGGKPTFRNCNFIDVGDWAIENNNDTVSVDARHNWWGHESGPGGMGPGQGVKVGDNVLFEPWLTEPVALQAVFEADTLYLQKEIPDSIFHFIQNVLNEGDSVRVEISDSLNWEGLSLNYEAALIDSFGFDSIQYLTYDPANFSGEVNKLTLNCSSLVYPNQTAKDSLYLISYEPQLDEILLFPDSLVLSLGEFWQFHPILMDQHRNHIESELLWWSDGPFINEEGLFTAEEEGIWNVWVSDIDQLDSAMVRIYVNALPELTDISISPEMAELSVDDTLRFEADGWDQFGEPFYFKPIWSTDGGSIDPFGLYTASEIGEFSVTAYNSDSTLWESAAVLVIFVHTADLKEQGDHFILHSVYPQPCTDYVNFNMEFGTRSKFALNIYDQMGRKQLCINERWYQAGIYELRVNTGTFPAGNYYYEIIVNGEKQTGKLIKL
jgi:parallel beta-helix repeat protein